MRKAREASGRHIISRMPRSYTNLIHHIVFSIRERRPLITVAREMRLNVSTSQMPGVERYIAGQKKHHSKRMFRDEFVQMLMVNEIEFDEKYLWT